MKRITVDALHKQWMKSPDYRREYKTLEEEFSLTSALIEACNNVKPSLSQHHYTVLLEPTEEGGYVVTCPALPGLVTEGDTLEEVREIARDAIRGYLESLQKDGDLALGEPPLKPKP